MDLFIPTIGAESSDYYADLYMDFFFTLNRKPQVIFRSKKRSKKQKQNKNRCTAPLIVSTVISTEEEEGRATSTGGNTHKTASLFREDAKKMKAGGDALSR